MKMATIKSEDRPKWILHGLIPYAVFPVAWLSSGEDTEKASLWCNCEQILANGGLGCLSARTGHFPRFENRKYSRIMPGNAIKTVGHGLSLNSNLEKLAAAIHSGALDDSVTYHIKDAQELIRLAYYMTRPGPVNMAHAVNCEECLHATFREHMGFVSALASCSDEYDESDDEDLRLRLNNTEVSYPFPFIRARRGYIDWHGVRELAPGAGRFAKLNMTFFWEAVKKDMHIVTLQYKKEPNINYCLLVSARKISNGAVRYIVLLVHGHSLFSENCKVFYSVKLNIIDLKVLHDGVCRKALHGMVSDHFCHPDMDIMLKEFQLQRFFDISSVHWGAWGLKNKPNERVEDENKNT